MKTTDLTIGGKSYPFYLGTLAVHRYCERQEYDLGDLISKFQRMMPKEGQEMENVSIAFSIGELLELLYQGLRDGHRKAKKDFTLTREDVADMADEESGLIIQVIPLFSDAITTLFGGEGNGEAPEPKKKPAKAKS